MQLWDSHATTFMLFPPVFDQVSISLISVHDWLIDTCKESLLFLITKLVLGGSEFFYVQMMFMIDYLLLIVYFCMQKHCIFLRSIWNTSQKYTKRDLLMDMVLTKRLNSFLLFFPNIIVLHEHLHINYCLTIIFSICYPDILICSYCLPALNKIQLKDRNMWLLC